MFLFHDYLNVKYLISRTPSPSVFKCVGWGRRAGCASVGRVLWGVFCRICFVGSAVPLYRRFSFSSSFYFLCCCTVHDEVIPNECGARTYHTDARYGVRTRTYAHCVPRLAASPERMCRTALHCTTLRFISSHLISCRRAPPPRRPPQEKDAPPHKYNSHHS